MLRSRAAFHSRHILADIDAKRALRVRKVSNNNPLRLGADGDELCLDAANRLVTFLL